MDIKKLAIKVLVIILFAIADKITDLGLPLWVAPFLYWLGEYVKEKGGITAIAQSIVKKSK